MTASTAPRSETAARRAQRRELRVLPGFRLSLGTTVAYLSLLVLVPLLAVVMRAARMGGGEFLAAATEARAMAAYRLTFGTALAAASTNVIAGAMIAWTLARYRFFGRRWIDALVDLPFALPTAVAGIALTSLYSEHGFIGRILHRFGIESAYSPLGIYIALTFIGLPFVVRSVQPVIEELAPELEEAAATLGASRRQTITGVILPVIAPALLSGFALAFARAIGEYGSVVFISGNMPMRTEIAPLLIVTQLEQYHYEAATAIATVLLVVSFAMLFAINALQRRSLARARQGGSTRE